MVILLSTRMHVRTSLSACMHENNTLVSLMFCSRDAGVGPGGPVNTFRNTSHAPSSLPGVINLLDGRGVGWVVVGQEEGEYHEVRGESIVEAIHYCRKHDTNGKTRCRYTQYAQAVGLPIDKTDQTEGGLLKCLTVCSSLSTFARSP